MLKRNNYFIFVVKMELRRIFFMGLERERSCFCWRTWRFPHLNLRRDVKIELSRIQKNFTNKGD